MKTNLHKKLEKMDYYSLVDHYVNQYHYDKMMAVLYDLSYHFNQLEKEEAEKQIDRLGSFESDDESGFIFEQIKSSMEMLNKRLDLDATKEKE